MPGDGRGNCRPPGFFVFMKLLSTAQQLVFAVKTV